MAKIQIKSEKLTPFGGIFSIMEQFDALLAQTIDSTLGLRCTLFGYQFCYQYSEILRSLDCSEKSYHFPNAGKMVKEIRDFFRIVSIHRIGWCIDPQFPDADDRTCSIPS
ncbi:transposase [Prevotella sp. CAG:386]|nr:transposase [Prevotella sp. CAG:386]